MCIVTETERMPAELVYLILAKNWEFALHSYNFTFTYKPLDSLF